MMSPFMKRVASACVLVPVTLGLIWAGGYWLGGLLILAFFISVYEVFRISCITAPPHLTSPQRGEGYVGLRRQPLAEVGWGGICIFLLSFFYLLLCFYCFWHLRELNVVWPILLIVAIWVSDTGAYFAGKKIGGPRMAPTISPNKTWAGFVGGAVGSGLVVAGYHVFIDPAFVSVVVAICVGVGVTLFGQIGDLMESAVKRRAGVKDSGHLIPGHGGVLDRIDSLLLASVYFFICVSLL